MQTSPAASAALAPCACGRAAGTGAAFGPWGACGGTSWLPAAADAESAAGRPGLWVEAADREQWLAT